ncbi:hypothetical protein [Geminisphaera colitermitum]|uniref:hypothetical protein n=1 Tax=Geminisphaera colitermitum TaxID=1148786 RepID=UPI0001965563|nr:hypothetical protein [Geminisphaera colitermitum]
MNLSPETLQPVPPGYVPSLGASSGTIVVVGVSAAELRLYQPGAAEPLVTLDAWTPNPATGAYTATLTLAQVDAIAAAGPTLHCQINGGPTFHVKNSGSGTGPSNPGSGGSNPGPGAAYTREEIDQKLTDIVAPAGGEYRLVGPHGERVLYVKRPGENTFVPAIGGGQGDIAAIAAGAPVEIHAQEEI